MAGIKQSTAKEWLKSWGITKRLGKIFAFYAQLATADYYFKGVMVVHRDHEYPGPEGSDIVYDNASLSKQVLSTTHTAGKILPLALTDDDTGMAKVEWLMQGETFNAFTDAEEVAPRMVEEAKRLDTLQHQAARRAHREEMEAAKQRKDGQMDWNVDSMTDESVYWEIQQDDSNIHLSRAKRRGDSDQMVNIALAASHGSMYANPHATTRLVGGLAADWRSKKLRPKRGRNTTLPMAMAYGREATLAHWYYAGIPEPPPGFIALVWRYRMPVLVVPNEVDYHRVGRAMDTWDNDSDKVTMFWLEDDIGKGALTLRRPMSVDGGTFFRLLPEDIEKLEQKGDKWNRKTGGHRWEGLYDVDKDGTPLRPSVLKPLPLEDKGQWNTNLKDPQEVLTELIHINKFAGAIGMASNYAANLDMAGAYNPDLHLFNMSEDVIDGTGNPEGILESLKQVAYETALTGTVDGCVWPRIRGEMGKLHREVTGNKYAILNVTCKCPAHHGQYHEFSSQAVKYLEEKLQRRELCANGPISRLTQEHDEALTTIVREAFAERNRAWRVCVKAEEEIKADKETTDYIKDTLKAKEMERAHKAEIAAVEKAFAEAVELPGYQYGNFTNVWIQLELNCRRRFKKSNGPAPITLRALCNLPPEEHAGFYGSGPSVATVIVRSREAPRKAKAAGVVPGEVLVVQKQSSSTYWLARKSDGQRLVRVRADAQYYMGMQLKVVGFLPDFQAPECNQVQMPPTQDEKPSYSLALRVMGA